MRIMPNKVEDPKKKNGSLPASQRLARIGVAEPLDSGAILYRHRPLRGLMLHTLTLTLSQREMEPNCTTAKFWVVFY